MKSFIKQTSILSVAITVAFVIYMGVQIAAAGTWSYPKGPPPTENTDEPINKGTVSQTKSAGLGLTGGLVVGLNAIFNGKVGIGTTNPQQRLHVFGTTPFGADNRILIEGPDPDIYLHDTNDNAAFRLSLDRDLFIQTDDNGNGTFANVTSRLIIRNDNGNVGIGTTNPTATLQLNGTASIFGMWQTSNAGTVYTAPTDGFVMAYDSKRVCIEGYTPSATIRVRAHTITDNESITFPVRKGDTWRVISSDCSGSGETPNTTVYWLPIGN